MVVVAVCVLLSKPDHAHQQRLKNSEHWSLSIMMYYLLKQVLKKEKWPSANRQKFCQESSQFLVIGPSWDLSEEGSPLGAGGWPEALKNTTLRCVYSGMKYQLCLLTKPSL
jgi:hypothetical protein